MGKLYRHYFLKGLAGVRVGCREVAAVFLIGFKHQFDGFPRIASRLLQGRTIGHDLREVCVR
jgi:hypothetical protein